MHAKLIGPEKYISECLNNVGMKMSHDIITNLQRNTLHVFTKPPTNPAKRIPLLKRRYEDELSSELHRIAKVKKLLLVLFNGFLLSRTICAL